MTLKQKRNLETLFYTSNDTWMSKLAKGRTDLKYHFAPIPFITTDPRIPRKLNIAPYPYRNKFCRLLKWRIMCKKK